MDNVKSITPNAPADFTPSLGNYKDLQPFRYWCHKVLPMVYDDSLSYYELLCKVVDYLNKTMEDVETLHGDVTNLREAYDELQSYVNNYFSTLDVQEEINNKLDSMAESGELYEIIRRYTDPIVNEQNDKINVLTARMDTFASLPNGSTTGDAELTDIRVGYNGNVYPSAGDAVRGQVSTLNSDILRLTYTENKNLLKLTNNNPFGCIFSSPTYVKSFKASFTSESKGDVTYIISKNTINEKITDGSIISGIKSITVNVNEYIDVDMVLDESYTILVLQNENVHINIVDSIYSSFNSYICGFESATNTIINLESMKNNYRFAYSFVGKVLGYNINVRQDGLGDFKTITEALSHYFTGDNIKINLGVGKYDEVINVGNKYNLSIIGEDKERCVVYNTSGKYRNAPFTICGNVYMENIHLAMYADDNFIPDISSQDTTAGYALHIDGESREPNSFNFATFVNCIFYSTAFPAVGLGTHNRQTITFENCEFVRDCTNEKYKFDNWKGAFIGHPDNGTEQNLIFKNCYFETNYGKSGNLRTDVGEPQNFTFRAINNTFYSKEEGVNSFEYIQGQTNLHGSSHGNTSTNLNAG